MSNWLRPNAQCSAKRLFFHTYGRGRDQHLMIPGWPYSFVAALESGRTSWCQLLDMSRGLPEGPEWSGGVVAGGCSHELNHV